MFNFYTDALVNSVNIDQKQGVEFEVLYSWLGIKFFNLVFMAYAVSQGIYMFGLKVKMQWQTPRYKPAE